ncbi:hypothetical protein [Thermoactinomyces sp. Gus2-1]|uniref:hypothetical protein n=1 Tax=Thermoactinomyces sp. Gus2-1 TaxID=1535750 RepID=UPI000690BFA7|nr:hypothetical protein [Thermoactinomyces sp. Gus2-1]
MIICKKTTATKLVQVKSMLTAMNEKANEAVEFMSFMASALRNGIGVNDKRVRDAIEKHIRFLQKDMDMDFT